MARGLFIIAQNGFRDEELFKPKEILEEAGHACVVSSITTDTATGKLGAEVDPDIAVEDTKASDWDVIIVVGGPGAIELGKHEEVNNILKDAKEKNINLASICIAPTVLAKAGVLEGKKATVWTDESKESVKILEEGKAIFVDQPVVVEDKLVTANGPAAAEEFGRKIAEMIKEA